MQTSSKCLKLAALLAFATAALPVMAATPTSGPTSTVVYAGGNDLVLKSSDGKLLNFTVPPSYRFTAGGKQLALGDLTPGTKLTAPVSTGFDPKIVTGISVVKGKVYSITPPDGVTLSTAGGIKEVNVPTGTTFMVDGKKVAMADLKNDMMVEATVITTAAEGESASSVPAQTGALLLAHTAGTGDLPDAGTHLPLFAALGATCLALGLGLLTFRKPVSAV